jgi:hypothetical protein
VRSFRSPTQLLQPIIHHAFERSWVRYAVCPCQEQRQFLEESDDRERSLKHCTSLQRAICRL